MTQTDPGEGNVLERVRAGRAGRAAHRIALKTTIGDNRTCDPGALAAKIGGPRARRLVQDWLSAGGSLHMLCDEGPPAGWPAALQERYAAAVALVRAADRSRPPRPGAWRQPDQVIAHVQQRLPLRREHFGVFLLDTRHHLLREEVLYQGTRNEVQVDSGEIMRMALAADAKYIVTWHNHPGGSTTPSATDIATWDRIDAAAKLMNLHCLDHLIVTTPGGPFYSRATDDPRHLPDPRRACDPRHLPDPQRA